MNDKICAIITAAGSGKRMGSSIAKQYMQLHGKPILRLTCEKFQQHPRIDSIVLVLPEKDCESAGVMIRSKWGITKLHRIVAGGTERHFSVWNGIQSLSQECEIVLIHDGVRPFVTDEVITKSIDAASEFGAAVVAVTPKDTVKRIQGKQSVDTLDRSALVLAQTPQTFLKNVIVDAFEYAFEHKSFSTDDAALVEQLGGRVQVVQGDFRNIKITTPEDLAIAQLFLEQDFK